MNIIRIRQDKRERDINEITGLIKDLIKKNKEIDFRTINIIVSSEMKISSRTAREYVLIALYRLNRLDIRDK